MAEQKTAAHRGPVQQFVCFKLADEEYALDIIMVREVIKIVEITPVPQLPEYVLGVMNNRGNVIPVFDLRKMIFLPDKDFDDNSRILVANVDNVSIGLVIDEVLDNIRLAQSQIDPAPSVRMKVEKEFIKGLGELENRMIAILDLTKMHESIKNTILNY